MAITPYPHQLDAVNHLGHPDVPGRLIADDMGLGKTLEALLIDNELRSERHSPGGNNKLHPCYKKPTLIVAPKATHYDAWVPAIEKLFDWTLDGDDGILVEVVDPKNRAKLVERLKRQPLPAYVIVHYEALRLIPELADVDWFHIICDEVHRVKNRKAQQTHYLKVLKTHYKTGLSGTPADDKPQDIWSVLNWLYPKQFSSYWRFVNTYCAQETETIRGGRSFRKITGVNRDRIPELHRIWAPWYIRRLKDDVLDSLPPKTYTEMYVDLLPAQRRAYEQMRKDMIAWIGENQDQPLVATIAVAQLVRLQQFALATVDIEQVYRSTRAFTGVPNERRLVSRVTLTDPSSKLDRLEEIIEGNPNEPLVVFTQSRSMVDLVVKRMHSGGISAVPYHGRISDGNRIEAVRSFQSGRAQVFAGTIAAGGEGITLHRASNMVFLDRMWNPTKNGQAEDREHRIGQEQPVQIIDIMASNTVDRGRHQRITDKWSELRWLLGDMTGA